MAARSHDESHCHCSSASDCSALYFCKTNKSIENTLALLLHLSLCQSKTVFKSLAHWLVTPHVKPHKHLQIHVLSSYFLLLRLTCPLCGRDRKSLFTCVWAWDLGATHKLYFRDAFVYHIRVVSHLYVDRQPHIAQ